MTKIIDLRFNNQVDIFLHSALTILKAAGVPNYKGKYEELKKVDRLEFNKVMKHYQQQVDQHNNEFKAKFGFLAEQRGVSPEDFCYYGTPEFQEFETVQEYTASDYFKQGFSMILWAERIALANSKKLPKKKQGSTLRTLLIEAHNKNGGRLSSDQVNEVAALFGSKMTKGKSKFATNLYGEILGDLK